MLSHLSPKTALLLLILTGLLLYFNSLFNGFIIGDDEDQLLHNQKVHSLINLPQFFLGSTYYRPESGQSYGLYYRPLMQSTYAFLYTLVGPDPIWYHLLQISLHLTNTLLVYSLFRRFFSSTTAFFSALIFLVHPVNSETVLHVANLQEVLFLFFGLLALHSLVTTQKKSLNPLLLTGLLFLSLLAKETGFLFIALALIYCLVFARSHFSLVSRVGGLVLISYTLLRFGIARIGLGSQSIAPLAHSSLATRLLTLPQIITHYFTTFAFPQHLLIAQFWQVDNPTLLNFFLPLLLLIFLATLTIAFFRSLSSTSARHLFLFFLTWFLLTLIPHLNLIPLDVTVADRWFYLPLIGLIGLLTVIIHSLLSRFTQTKLLLALVLTPWLILLTSRTFIRTFDWRDSLTLVSHDLKYSPGNYFLANNYATLLIRDKKFIEAKPYIEASLQKYPYFGNLNNAAIIAIKDGNLPQAQAYFEQALALGQNYETYVNYANSLLYVFKDYQATQTFAQKSLALYPNSAPLWLVLAQAESQLNNHSAALEAAHQAFDLDPNDLTQAVLSAVKANRPPEVEPYLDLPQ